MPPESDAPGNEPNLELPSLGFGRKKKRAKKPRTAADGPLDPTVAEETPAPAAPAAPREDAPAPGPVAPRAPSAPPAPARAAGAAPTPARPPARPAARPPARPAAAQPRPATPPVRPATPPARPAAPVTPPPAPRAAPRLPDPATAVLPASDPEPTTILAPPTEPTLDPLDEAAAAMDAPRKRSRRNRGSDRADSRARRRAEKADRRRPAGSDTLVATLPAVKPGYAAFVTGVLSGLAAVGLAIGASRGCEAVRDTSSCGGGVGLLALVAILAIEVLIGANLLKAWRISDPFSTSFLGVGLVAIIAMLTFLSHLDSLWMLLVIPTLTSVSFVLSWWVTVRFVDEYDAEHSPGDAGPADEDVSGQEPEPVGQDEDSHA